MRLRILNVAYPFAPVGPDAVGGAEQVLTQIDAALARAGHESRVMACEGSITQGRLIPMPRTVEALDEATRRKVLQQYRSTLEQLLSREPVDVLHFHGIDFCDYLPASGVAALATLHLPPHWYPPKMFQLERPLTFLHCVSAAQRRVCPPSPLLWPEIENGILPELLLTRHGKRRFVLALGRICPEKGFHLALEAARRAQVPLLLAGQVFRYDAHEQYFQREIAPRLDRSRRFIGPVGLKRKRRLLSAARCLLAPSLVPETSSLVVMEALACGTPVIAFRSGALAELVEHGKTGFLVKDYQEMAEAIRAVDSLDRMVCRQTAAERFSLKRMLAKYFAAYEKLAKLTREVRSPAVVVDVSSALEDSPQSSPPLVAISSSSPVGQTSFSSFRSLPPGQGYIHCEILAARGGASLSPRSWTWTVGNKLSPPSVEIESITTTEALEALAPEWYGLWERCPAATPFQTPDWLIAWWKYLAGVGLHTFALRAAGRLVGLAPWFLYDNPQTAAREVLLLGTGITDVLNVLLEPAYEQAGAAALLRALANSKHRWDACDFQQLRAHSPLAQVPAPNGWTSESVQQEVCPVLRLPENSGQLLQSPAAPLLKRASYYWRRLEKLGPTRIELAHTGNFSALFEGLLRLHGARWAAAGRPGVLADAAIAHFHRASAAGLLARGLLRLYGLYVGDRLIGCWYGFAGHKRVCYYLGGFEPEFAPLSPGTVLIGHALQQAAQSGAVEFDFLRGSEPYKYRWGAVDCPNYRRLLR